jgi:hypothetical protein
LSPSHSDPEDFLPGVAEMFGTRAEVLGKLVANEENLVDDAERRRPMRDDHHGHPSLFQLRDAFGERGIAF